MVMELDPRLPRAANEACAPDPVLSEALLRALETTRRHWGIAREGAAHGRSALDALGGDPLGQRA